jgi:hypothetical protein
VDNSTIECALLSNNSCDVLVGIEAITAVYFSLFQGNAFDSFLGGSDSRTIAFLDCFFSELPTGETGRITIVSSGCPVGADLTEVAHHTPPTPTPTETQSQIVTFSQTPTATRLSPRCRPARRAHQNARLRPSAGAIVGLSIRVLVVAAMVAARTMVAKGSRKRP